MPTNKYVPDEIDERHNDLEQRVAEAMARCGLLVPRVHELRGDDFLIRQYAEIGHELAAVYRRLYELADHL